jgi:hypothetical protein
MHLADQIVLGLRQLFYPFHHFMQLFQHRILTFPVNAQKQIKALAAGLQKVSAQLKMSKPVSQMVVNEH